MIQISTEDIADAPLADLVARASNIRILDEQEEALLVGRCLSGQEAALDVLVRAHLRLAVDEAIRNRGLGARQDRLARAAARALVESAPEYEPTEHGSFSEWARRIVRDAIKTAMTS